MNKNLQIGIIAENPEAKFYYNALKENKSCKIKSVYSKSEEILGLFDCQKNDNYIDLIKDKNINLIAIITDPPTTYKMAIESLNANKNIAIEYPLTESPQEAKNIIEIAKKKKCKIYIFIPLLFYPPYCKGKELIQQREIGEIQAIRIKSIMNYHEGINRELLLLKNTYEKLFLAYYLMEDIERIFSYGFSSKNTYAPAMTIWKYKEPCKYGILETVFYFASEISENFETNKNTHTETIEISGTSGYIWLSNKRISFQNIPTLQVYRKDKLFSYENLQDNWYNAYKGCVNDSINYFLNKKTHLPIVNPHIGLKILNWTISAFQSSNERKEILLNSI